MQLALADDVLVVAEQLVADRRPGAAQHAAARGHRVALAFGDQVVDGLGQLGLEFVDFEQQPGAVGGHQVARSPRIRGDDRQARRHRLLHRLAERLVFAGVDEDIHAGVRRGELIAVQRAGENR